MLQRCCTLAAVLARVLRRTKTNEVVGVGHNAVAEVVTRRTRATIDLYTTQPIRFKLFNDIIGLVVLNLND